MSDAVFVIDQDMKILYANPASESLTGYSFQESVGRQCGEIFCEPSPLCKEGCPPKQAMRDNMSVIHRDAETRSKAGEIKQTHITISPFTEGGPCIGSVIVVKDITELKKAEDRIQRQSDFLSAVIDALPHPFYVIDASTYEIKLANKAACSGSLVPGITCYEYSHHSPSPCISRDHPCPFEQVKNMRQAVNVEHVHFDAKGNRRNIDVRCFPMFDDEGRVVQVGEYNIDITERKEAEEKLRESQNFLKTIIETEPECVKLVSRDGKLIMMNRAGLAMIEADSLDQVKGKSVYSLVSKEHREVFQKLTDDVFLGKPGALEFEMVGIKGRRLVLETKAVPLRNEKDEIIALLGIARDVTGRKKMERELLNVQRLESVGILAGGIAHDFNNLLTAIMGNISLAKTISDPGSASYRGLVEAEEASLRARDLTQQLLTFAKGGTPIKKLSSPEDIVRDAAGFALRGSNVRCEFSLEADLWPVEVDVGQISQAVNNIVINAVQAMPQGGTVRINCRNIIIEREGVLPLAEGRYVLVSVRDRGTGIPKEFIQRVFDPYFSTKQKGSGLGLAIAYSIMKRHGGHISVESEIGVGSTFHLYLAAATDRITKTVDSGDEVRAGQGRVLVMDDQAMVREVAGALLTRLGYEVELTADGEEAVARYLAGKLSGRPFDAVIMDLTVPGGMGGTEALKKLLSINPAVKAIVSSGYSNDPVMADFSAYGFRGIILKPYKIKELGDTLRAVLSSGE